MMDPMLDISHHFRRSLGPPRVLTEEEKEAQKEKEKWLRSPMWAVIEDGWVIHKVCDSTEASAELAYCKRCYLGRWTIEPISERAIRRYTEVICSPQGSTRLGGSE